MFTHIYTLRPYCNLPTQKKTKHENKTKQNWFAATFRDQNVDYDKKYVAVFLNLQFLLQIKICKNLYLMFYKYRAYTIMLRLGVRQ